MDAGWLNDQLAQGERETQERYRWFMRPEPKEVLSDIEVEPETGLRFRLQRIGMMRNAADKNKRVVRVYLDPLPHVRLEEGKPLQGWYKGAIEPERVRRRPCFTEAILTEPYGGFCMVGCAFCYINAGMRGYRGTGLITVPLDYGAHVKKQLSTMRTAAAGYFSSFTDPFLELESIYHNTQQGAQAFVDAGLPIFFLSRLRYPGWAIDMLTKNPHSYAQKSINTPDESDWRKLSPGALSLAEHLEQIRELRQRGIYTSIQVNPVVAGITSVEQVEQLFEMLAAVGNNHVIVKFVEAAYSWAPAMIERMKSRFGAERAARFEELFNCNIGSERTIDEGYRMDAHTRLRRKASSVRMTYATCYEYRFERDSSGEILNRTGVSVGRDFATSEQCHGHRVPLYSRDDLGGAFLPLEACPPSGCLYCASENHGEPRCGDSDLGAAKARRLPDMRKGLIQIGGRA